MRCGIYCACILNNTIIIIIIIRREEQGCPSIIEGQFWFVLSDWNQK